MATADMFLKMFHEQIILSLNTCYVAKVLSYNEQKCEATIQPLFMTKEYEEEPEKQDAVEDVPVLKQVYRVNGGTEQTYVPVLKNGMKVLCVVSQRSLDDYASGQPYYPGAARIMNMQDSVIVGVMP